MLVPAEKSDELIEVTLPAGRASTSRVGDFPHDAARAAGRTFVADELADTVSVLEGGPPSRRRSARRFSRAAWR